MKALIKKGRQQQKLLKEIKMYLYGASGHGKVVADILLSLGNEISAIYDDNPKEESILGIPVLHTDKLSLVQNKQCIISVGDNRTRKNIFENLKAIYITAVHKTAVVSPFSEIGEGTVVMAQATINPNAKIGKHCIVNTASIIEHDCQIGNFVHISPNVALAGNVEVGEGSHIGIGACVIQGVKIGKWCTIGAGTVIIKDIPDGATVVGNPGRIIRYNP